MASLRILVSAVSTDVISTRNIRLIDQDSVVNMWASCVTVTDEIGLNLGSITLMDPSTMNIRAAAVGLVLVEADQLIFNLIVGPNAGDLAIPVPTLTTSCIFILSVEPV
ncbi:MAG: hypothetical protein V3S25_00645 [Nitrospirales bacterium]